MYLYVIYAVQCLFRPVVPTAAKSMAKPKAKGKTLPKAKGKTLPKAKGKPKVTGKPKTLPKPKVCEKKRKEPTVKAKQAAKKPAAPRVLKNDTNNKYSRAYHAAKRKGLSKEEAGHAFSN